MPYTSETPTKNPTSEQLRARIPGWGADLDRADRPAVPMARLNVEPTGAHWQYPESQEEAVPRERSIEHAHLTPVFGTSAPLHGLSGVLRRVAYRRFSEGRAAHWLILIGADRVDALGAHLRSFATLHPDNPITQTGVRSEFTHHGIRSRFGKKRADLKHQWLDPIIVAGPWVLVGVLLYRLLRSAKRK